MYQALSARLTARLALDRRTIFSRLHHSTVAIVLVFISSVSPSYAIPSPDLVVGSISSISQLVTLLSAMLGGSAAIVGIQASSNTATGRASRIAWRLVWFAAALLALSLGANRYQYSTAQTERQTRLEAAIQRATITTDGHTLDPNLKEPTYSEQLSSPRGISTSEMQQLVEDKEHGLHKDELIIDVRENAETSMGSLPGAILVRFPDFSQAHLDLKGKKAILYCDNGNRSWQTCQELSAIGIDCRFMVGGLEKWFAEHRPLGDKKATTLADFRSLPPFPNKDVLLDTPDVHSLISAGGVFVDVRYPREFDAYHLPGAINLPIRPTLLDELNSRIANLPHHPIIAPCYDRRSCFYALILGYEVTRAGGDFAGRYTLPWDYFIAPPARPYIVEYLKQIRETWWSWLVEGVAGYVNPLADYVGFLPAIILLALFSRLLVLPFSIKAERDQLVARECAPLVEDLKSQFQSDPPRLARAMRAFYRQHSLTPLRNLIGLAFLPLMSVCVAATTSAAIERDEPLLWVTHSADCDQFFLLPLVFAVLICLYLDNAFVRSLRQRILVWLIGLIILTATASLLNFAADTYLVASAFLLLLQRAVATKQIVGALQWFSRHRLGDGLISVDDVSRLSDCGNKAHRLGIMRSHGFPVPEGVVLTARFLAKFAVAPARWRLRRLNRIWSVIGAEMLAVRSSGSAEDNSSNSFAGIFASVLHVDRARFEDAVLGVMASFNSAIIKGYGVENAQSSIIAQRMIEPEYSGVLFTRDPACPSLCVVELVEGTADRLVSGAVAPLSYRFGRVSLTPLSDTATPIDLQPLLAIAHDLETLFDAPQDIEWVYLKGSFFIVQSRDITVATSVNAQDAMVQNEWARVLDSAVETRADEVAFEQNELSEVLPRPTRLSLSLMESLWDSGGSIDIACRRIGIPYRIEEDSAPYLVTILGALYVNKGEELARSTKLGQLAVWRLNKIARTTKTSFKETFLPQFLKEIALLEAVDFKRLSTVTLLDTLERIRKNYVLSTSVTTSVINIVADYRLKQAKSKLAEAGLEPTRFLVRLGQTEFERTIAHARGYAAENRNAFVLHGVGHRSPIDYELAEPRYSERISDLARLVKIPIPSPQSARHLKAQLAALTNDARLIAIVLEACSFQTLKEDAKHHSLREVAVLRRALQAVDHRFGLDGAIYQLTFEEITALVDRNRAATLRSIAIQRRNRAARLGSMGPLSPALSVRQLEHYSIGLALNTVDSPDAISGIRVSGSGLAEGRACVVAFGDECATDIPGFVDGDIVISRMVPITWIPYFNRAGGFICEVGGWLSHTAIVAREFNVPLIVQAKAIHFIQTGQTIRLYPDGAVEIVQQDDMQIAASPGRDGRGGRLVEKRGDRLSSLNRLNTPSTKFGASPGTLFDASSSA